MATRTRRRSGVTTTGDEMEGEVMEDGEEEIEDTETTSAAAQEGVLLTPVQVWPEGEAQDGPAASGQSNSDGATAEAPAPKRTRTWTQEQKDAMRNKMLAFYTENPHVNKGKPLSDAHKEKIRQSAQQRAAQLKASQPATEATNAESESAAE